MASLNGIPAHYNKKSSAVKRIMQEARELAIEPSTDFAAGPLESDIFEWHFTIRGPEESDFDGGLYHGRILLPNNYPFAPPSLMFLTPNGRFELNKKVCLSITGYHPEYWQPAWGIRTVLVAVRGFLPTESKGAIGGLDTSVAARKALAIRSKSWVCSTCCESNVALLPDVAPGNVIKASLKADEMPSGFSFGYEADKKKGQEKEQEQKQADNNSTRDNSSNETSRSASIVTVTSTNTNAGENHPSPPTQPTTTTTTTIPSIPENSVRTTPQDPPRTSNPPTHASNTAVLRARTSVPQQRQQQQQTQSQGQVQTRHVESGIPIWFDALLFGLAGILVVMVIRRFM
ncbi:ubiquitin-conjugating enzyme/RWD-like protein [Mortierella sp. GBAus27b]|nr:ubiquitin-conjugating enzyme/RWD-like protein [Mortierella sp. GBAus27b]